MFGFDKMFDFNRDGKLDSLERAIQFQFISYCKNSGKTMHKTISYYFVNYFNEKII